jgi:molybdopterin molybdotransferase
LGAAAFTGLPGNPFAVHVGFHMFVLPQIARLLGAPPASFASVPALSGFEWARKPGRAEVFPVRLTAYDDTGLPVLQRLGESVSATLLPLSDVDGLAIVPAETSQIKTGTPLLWRPFCHTGDI